MTGAVTVTQRDCRTRFNVPSTTPLRNSTSTIVMQRDIHEYSSQNDYDYLGCFEDEILPREDCVSHPPFQHQEDDFDDYMNRLCGYMLPNCTQLSLTIRSDVFSLPSSTPWYFVCLERIPQIPAFWSRWSRKNNLSYFLRWGTD